MKKILAALACLTVFGLAAPLDADAARMGGGRSFGGAPSMSRPAPMPSRPAPTMDRAAPNMNRQTPGATAAAPSRGFGGMFTGLLAGSLIGSLLMGHGFAGGGSFLDLLLLGGLAYLVFRMFSRRRAAAPGPQRPQAAQRASGSGRSAQDLAWNRLRDPDEATRAFGGQPRDTLRPEAPFGAAGVQGGRTLNRELDMDEEEFLRGAKMAYARMQESWDRRDLDDIAQFATPAVIDMLKLQMAEEPEPSRTELLLVNASLAEMRIDGPLERAAVLFDVLMREDQRASEPTRVLELWHFARGVASRESWKLDGIQQIDG